MNRLQIIIACALLSTGIIQESFGMRSLFTHAIKGGLPVATTVGVSITKPSILARIGGAFISPFTRTSHAWLGSLLYISCGLALSRVLRIQITEYLVRKFSYCNIFPQSNILVASLEIIPGLISFYTLQNLKTIGQFIANHPKFFSTAIIAGGCYLTYHYLLHKKRLTSRLNPQAPYYATGAHLDNDYVSDDD
jgi:hypothetical protein